MDWKASKAKQWLPVLSSSSILLFAVGIGFGLLISLGLTKETAAIYAVIIAATIGLFAYKWQKNIDRETEILSERRRAYTAYQSAAMRLFFSQPFAGEGQGPVKFLSICEEELSFYEARNAAYLIAPKELGEALKKHSDSMRDWIVKYSDFLESSEGNEAGGFENGKAEIGKLSAHERGCFHNLIELMRDDAALPTNLFVTFSDWRSDNPRK